MENIEELRNLLEDLGLGKTEASAYLELLFLAKDGPATGYLVAKSLGKDPNTVYRALEDLEKRGAVETSEGRGKQFRPIAPGDLLGMLQEDYTQRARAAAARLKDLPGTDPGSEVYQLPTVAVALERFNQLLEQCQQVAILDLSPAVLSFFKPQLIAAKKRGVAVVVRLYISPGDQIQQEMSGLIFTIDPDGPLAQELMPGQIMRGVFDCHSQLMAYLPSIWQAADPDLGSRPLPLAYWSANPAFAYQGHMGLASEIIHTETRAMLIAGHAQDEIQGRQYWLTGKIHGPVDWENLWRRSGQAEKTLTGQPHRQGSVWGRVALPPDDPTPSGFGRGMVVDLVRRKRALEQGKEPARDTNEDKAQGKGGEPEKQPDKNEGFTL